MKIKISDTVRITDITQQQIRNLMKCNINFKVNAKNIIGESIDFVYLLNRTNTKQIVVSKAKNAVKKQTVSYSEAAEMILEVINSANSEHGIYEIVIEKNDYNSNRKLLKIFENLRKDIADGLVYLDYKNNMWICKFKNEHNFIESLYYWPETTGCYAFGEDEVKLFDTSHVNDIEQLLCY